ncbi:Rft-1-domain-containing protein [Patellaria atrata CBS 101060]|uniref:Man(5)GlcNAc(2)-PP-dolichol translocation protein RFT1 n=1 Tax=Patellaria atrata CBS 101060 TaxID=1346257 RepID=A0A9P4VJF4_9PEZI|nr:Rft-1-domain-containing protein [Patellaria atrata CBS 101060]
MSASILSASAKGATFLILTQISSRALTFIVNQVLLRFLSPELLGISAQLELYSISVLFFARESIRVALQRQINGPQVVINLSYLSICLGIPLAYTLATFYLRNSFHQVPFFKETVFSFGSATILELLAEPCFAATQQMIRYKTRATAETAATIAKCVTTCSLAVWANRSDLELGPFPFAGGQLAYAATLLSTYLILLRPLAEEKKFSLLPVRLESEDQHQYIFCYFSRPLCQLSISLFIQSGIKYVLTSGDALLITSLATLREQGSYALASNYGGLTARMLFQPIEESSRNLFAKLCAPQEKDKERSEREKEQATEVLYDILRLYHIISLVACALGPKAAPLLLRIVAGAKWADTEASLVLSSYCYYIPLLALNGVTEAFVAAVADITALRIQSFMMGFFFVAFAISAYLFLHTLEFGAQGLVYANCINMLLRIIFNIHFIKGVIKPFDYTVTLPSKSSIAVAICIPVILKSTEHRFSHHGVLGEISSVGIVAVPFGAFLLYSEWDYAVRCYRMFRPVKRESKSAR